MEDKPQNFLTDEGPSLCGKRQTKETTVDDNYRKKQQLMKKNEQDFLTDEGLSLSSKHQIKGKQQITVANNCCKKQRLTKEKQQDFLTNEGSSYCPKHQTKGKQCIHRWRKIYADAIGTHYLNQDSISTLNSIPLEYTHLGQCTCVCRYCGAMFWECEKVESASYGKASAYNKCCYGGRIVLRPPPEYPQYIKESYNDAHFMDNIRAYNQMFSMTSLGANIDNSVNTGKGPYVFRVSGQIYHWIGSMCPDEGKPPRFLQLYICDTTNEINNRLAHFHNNHDSKLKKEIVEGLIEFLDNHNALVQLFRTARDKYMEADIPEFKLTVAGWQTIQQHIVTAYYAIEQNRLDYIRQKQSDIRNEYLSGIYDAIVRGDRDGSDLGLRTVLTASFTGGPRYMYAQYLDALAICRVHGSPSFFITFTCNAKWPEIEEFMKQFPQLTTADRADIVDRVFEKKVRDYVNFVRSSNTFGDVTAELSDPTVDAAGYSVVLELMIHGPCGATVLYTIAEETLASTHKDEMFGLIIGTDRVVANVTKPVADVASTSNTPSIHVDKIKNYVEARPINICASSCSAGDLFCERMLLCHQKGCRSFAEIRTLNGITYPTNKAACQALGLLGGDEEWIGAFQEAALSATASKLRKFFVHILIFCNVADPMKLWQRLWKDMADDIPRRLSKSLHIPEIERNEKKMKATILFDLEAMLNSYSKTQRLWITTTS
nr:DNA helicase [Tanacetum cinerariifolium]